MSAYYHDMRHAEGTSVEAADREAFYAAEAEALAFERHQEARHGFGGAWPQQTAQDIREELRDADILSQEPQA